jgi:uncharacterized protein (TIGR00290 family)
VAWSGGKDSAWCLRELRARPELEVAGVFTTVVEGSNRVAVHQVRGELLTAQADAAGVALHRIPIPDPCPNKLYEERISAFAAGAKADGVTHLAFGDLFLEDIRRYRERQFANSGLQLLFPLWGRPTPLLAREMTLAGLRAWITCVDATQAPAAWAGRMFDDDFVAQVPPGVDPCGENGEFHTFVVEGPMLRHPIAARPAQITRSGRWVYADIVAA